MEGRGRPRKVAEGSGRPWKAVEGFRRGACGRGDGRRGWARGLSLVDVLPTARSPRLDATAHPTHVWAEGEEAEEAEDDLEDELPRHEHERLAERERHEREQREDEAELSGDWEAIRTQSGGDWEAIGRRPGGDREVIRRRSGGNQEAVRSNHLQREVAVVPPQHALQCAQVDKRVAEQRLEGEQQRRQGVEREAGGVLAA